MGFRFQKRISILPGVRINLSKSGVSTSLGPRGADVNIGKDGVTANAGIPGTGLSYRQKVGSKGKSGWLAVLLVIGGLGVWAFQHLGKVESRAGARPGFIHRSVHRVIHRAIHEFIPTSVHRGVSNFAGCRECQWQHAAFCPSRRRDSARRTKGFRTYPQERVERRRRNPCFANRRWLVTGEGRRHHRIYALKRSRRRAAEITQCHSRPSATSWREGKGTQVSITRPVSDSWSPFPQRAMGALRRG